MDARIAEFTALLRENGLRVSMSEHLDAFRAVERLGLGDREGFRDVLRATMVKRGTDVPVFDELFDLYFSGLGRVVRQSSESLMQGLEVDEEGLDALLESLQGILDELGVELSELGRALLRNDTGELQRLLQEAAEQARVQDIQRSFQEGKYRHATAQALGIGGVSEELERLEGALAGLDLPEEQRRTLERLLDRRLQDLADMIRRMVRLELQKHDASLRERNRLNNLAEKSFYYLSEEEIRRMQEAVTRLAQRLKNVVQVRRRRSRRGRFDVKATLRRNLQYGGVPFRIELDRRVRDKPRVLVLCDVSDSVRNVSRFMLQFVYSLQDLYSKVRSFIFVSDLAEITDRFAENDINEAIQEALTGNVVNVFAHSDFGRAFRTFHRDFLGAVNGRTTVLVLGDARNNYNAPHEWVLRDVQQRAKQVIWLNPENRLTWGFGDSEMDRYLPYCDVVEECRNLNQLYRVIDRMMR